jgi:hypothetical protein
MTYYLTGGIYPRWATFVKIIHEPYDEKGNRFAKEQEPCRKDVECCNFVGRLFGTLLGHVARRDYGRS